MTRVLIVDDHAVVRAGVKHILSKCGGYSAEEAVSPMEALRLVSEHRWDIVLIDISMPDMNGVELLRRIKDISTDINVLVMSMHPEARYALQVMRGGANGYIQKECLGAELIKAISTVVSGKKYISLEIEQSLTTPDVDKEAPHHLLSPRESDIFFRLAQGVSVTKIAELLDLSVKTVSTHKSRILDKMNMKLKAELVYYAIHNNLVD